MTKQKLVGCIAIIVISTLSLIVISMSVAMMIGLFNDKVSNEEVFKIIQPAYSTVMGAFIGLISGFKLGQTHNDQ